MKNDKCPRKRAWRFFLTAKHTKHTENYFLNMLSATQRHKVTS
ncbi:Uncharacterized protein dnm_077510 [Desulfonema magnum]|uniref:Uncharacterized protein n=1 Tax=Desulfonema magnum TaxID=45655 RepID=A0A975GT25_9BACT|nr:Uncharacterized protein dnm_077510 [Desulfonema magnum]